MEHLLQLPLSGSQIKKGLAGGLTAAGFGLGPLIIGPVAKALIASMGFTQHSKYWVSFF